MDVNLKDPIFEFLPDTVETVRKIYNLDNGRMVQSVNILDDWIQKQNHFLKKDFNRRYLELTIIACKGSIEKAKTKIDKLCTYRTLLPKFFMSKGIKSTSENVIQTANFLLLPKMTKDYQRVAIFKIKVKSLTSSAILDYYRIAVILAEYTKTQDYVDGVVFIEDLRDANLIDCVTNLNWTEFQQFITIVTEGFGTRLKGAHIVSQSKAIDIFIKTMKSVLSEKIANRIHLHPEIEDLHKVIEKEILPVDYGGEERSIEELQTEWVNVISSEETEKYLEIMRTSGTDESQRQTDNFKEQYECVGAPGSFRTLTVD